MSGRRAKAQRKKPPFREALGPSGLRLAEARKELVPVVEALKAIPEGLGLGSGSPEHKMCLRQG